MQIPSNAIVKVLPFTYFLFTITDEKKKAKCKATLDGKDSSNYNKAEYATRNFEHDKVATTIHLRGIML
jgi:hypothetical protein